MRYEICVGASLDRTWSRWFDDMDVEPVDDDRTRLTGRVADQAALHGLLARVRDLGLEVISVVRIDQHNEAPS